MKKLMITLVAAQALMLAAPMVAHADVLHLAPTADPSVAVAADPDVTFTPTINAPFSGR